MWYIFVYYGVRGDSSAFWMLQSADCSHNHKWRGSWPAANHLWACPLSSTASTRRARLPNILIFRLKRDTLSATVLARAISRINREISFNLKKNVDYSTWAVVLGDAVKKQNKTKKLRLVSPHYNKWGNALERPGPVWHLERCRPWRTAAVVSHLQSETVNGWTFLLNQAATLLYRGNCLCNNTKLQCRVLFLCN